MVWWVRVVELQCCSKVLLLLSKSTRRSLVGETKKAHYNTGRFICVVQKWVIPLANWHGRLLNLPVGKLPVTVYCRVCSDERAEYLRNYWTQTNEKDLWHLGGDSVDVFQKNLQWGLIIVPQVRILLFFEAWWLRKKCHLALSSLSTKKHFAHKRQC